MDKNRFGSEETCEGTRYTIDYEEDGVYFTVCPSDDGLTKADENRILNLIKRKNIMGIDSNAVFNAMYVKPNERVRIADAQKEVLLDQEIAIRVKKGGMEAWGKLLPDHGGHKLTLEEALQEIQGEGIVFGIDKSAVKEMLNEEDYYKEVPIAYGQSPRKGQDAQIKYHVEFNRQAKPEILEDGTVNYRQLDLIQNVSKGQVLTSLTPATEGISGKTVLGKNIQAMSGKRLRLPKGKNVIISEDGLALMSMIDGKAEMKNGKIHVYAIYEVMGNVDNSTGNIDFVGNVIVNGNVLTGFEVKSKGYIEVRGVVEGAKLISEGNVVLKKGMQGMGKGSIQSQGNVIARFIENSIVEAKGNVTAEAILHSRVNCGGKVEVAGKKGLVAGGSIAAGVEISAMVAGSPMATNTELEVGASPLLRDEYSHLKSEIDKISQELKQAEQILVLLDRMESRGRLSVDKANMRLKTIKTKLIHNQRIPGIKARIEELEDIFNGVSTGRINIRGTIHPGVKITIGSSMLYIRDAEQHVTYKREHGDIIRISFQG